MDDALFDAVEIEKPDTEFAAIFSQRLHLFGGNGIIKGTMAVKRRDRMVHRRERKFRPPNSSPVHPQAFEGLRRSDLVNEVQIDIQKCRLVRLLKHDMRFPDLIVKRFHQIQTASEACEAFDPSATYSSTICPISLVETSFGSSMPVRSMVR